MFRLHSVLAAVLFLTLPVGCQRVTPVTPNPVVENRDEQAKVEANPGFVSTEMEHPFKNAKIGDFISYQVTMNEKGKNTEDSKPERLRMEVTAKNEKTVTLIKSLGLGSQTETYDITKGFDPIPRSLESKATGKFDKMGEGKEKLEVNGKEYDCIWISGISVQELGSSKIELEVKAWFCKGIPLNGMIKMETKEAIKDGLDEVTFFHFTHVMTEFGNTNDWGEPLPKGGKVNDPDEPFAFREPKEKASFKRENLRVVSVAFSPDSKTLALGCTDGGLFLWDVPTGKLRTTLIEPAPPSTGGFVVVKSVAFSPDGKTFASASTDKSEAVLWDVATGKKRAALKGHESIVHSLAFSPDSETLATGSNDRTIKLWDVATSKVRIEFENRGQVYCVAYSPDGKTVASVGRSHVHLWDVKTGKVRVFQGENRLSVAFSGDGKTLAATDWEGNVTLWDLPTGKERPSFKANVHTIAFSKDGKILAGGGGRGEVKLWHVATGKELATLKGHAGQVLCVAFSNDGKLLATGGVGEMKLWDLAPGK